MSRFHKIDALGVAVLIILPASAYWLSIAPALRSNAAGIAMAGELDQQRTFQDSLEHSVASAKLSGNDISTTRPTLRLIPVSDSNHRLSELNDSATGGGLQINSLEAADTIAHDRYASVPIRLSAQGRYRSCESWLAELHAHFPDVAVIQWQLTDATADKDGVVQLSAVLRWYAAAQSPQK